MFVNPKIGLPVVAMWNIMFSSPGWWPGLPSVKTTFAYADAVKSSAANALPNILARMNSSLNLNCPGPIQQINDVSEYLSTQGQQASDTTQTGNHSYEGWVG